MLFRIASLAAVVWAAAAHAAPLAHPALGEDEVKAQKVRIEEQFDQAQARCKRLQGPPRELCNEQARGERDVQAAQLQLRRQPTPENDEKVRLAKAEAAYSQSLVKCKGYDGQARRVCRADAKSTFEAARTEAKLQRDVVAQTLRSENTVRDRATAQQLRAEVEYNRLRERCETLPAEGRANCLAEARLRFGKE
jgi:hypothetical protein